MATATATATAYNAPYGIDQTNTRMHLYGALAIQASPATYASGGLLPNWSTVLDGTGERVNLPTINVNPDTCTIRSVSGSGYIYTYNKSSGKVQIFLTGTAANDPLNELANATAIAAGISGDVIEFHAEWAKD